MNSQLFFLSTLHSSMRYRFLLSTLHSNETPVCHRQHQNIPLRQKNETEQFLTKYLGLAKVELLPSRSLLQLRLGETVLLLVSLVELETRLKLADQLLGVLRQGNSKSLNPFSASFSFFR